MGFRFNITEGKTEDIPKSTNSCCPRKTGVPELSRQLVCWFEGEEEDVWVYFSHF